MNRISSKPLLLVDDEAGQRTTLTDILSDEGFDVRACSNSEEALSECRDSSFGIAIVDLRLGDVNGIQLLEDIRCLQPNIRAIIHTGFGSYDSAKAALNLGAFAYVEKLAAPEQLVEYVRRADREILSEALSKSENRYRTLVENAPVCIHEVDLDGRLISMNPAGLKMLGAKNQGEILGCHYLNVVCKRDQDHVSSQFSKACQGESTQFEYSFSDEFGARPVDSSFVPLKSSDRHVEKLMGITADVGELREANLRLEDALSQLKQSEREVIQQERLRAIGEMTCGVAHNLNNLLSPATMLTELILAEPSLPDRVRDWASLIKTGTADATELVKQLSVLYGVNSSTAQTEQVDLKALVEQIPLLTRFKWQDEALKEGREIKFKLEVSDVPPVQSSASDLRQVLTNLVLNSVDAMPRGGEITLRLSATSQACVIELIDTGSGMTADQKMKCFEPFFTTKATGTGLGLSVCDRVIRQLGGKLDLESSLGQGTSFRLTLPITPLDATDTKGSADVVSERKPSRRILYIDDSSIVCRATETLLTAHGHQVSVAENGRAGLEEFARNKYDVVITDYSMPGMTGREVAASVKQSCPDTMVVLLTGWPVHQLGASDDTPEDMIVQKPLSIETLNSLVEQLGVPAN